MANVRLSGNARKELAERIKADIDTACKELFPSEHRNHLGASLIGRECSRYLWYVYRWAHLVDHSGRMRRLFNRGHLEEPRIVAWLEAMGCSVWAHNETGEQFRIKSVKGHFGGSLDGIMKLPERYGLDINFLGEFKTHNKASFTKLVKNTVRMAKPEHYHQQCVYGKFYEFDYSIYIAVCKDDDEVYVEVMSLDKDIAGSDVVKADKIINSQSAPPRIAASAAYDKCKFCDMKGICHNGEPVDVNCRSCQFAQPVEDAKWFCQKWQMNIPEDAIKVGCTDWAEIDHR